MRHRREFRHHDTSSCPQQEIWIEQTAIPINDQGDWFKSPTITFNEAGEMVFPQGIPATARISIPGVIDGHLYRFTITIPWVGFEGSIGVSFAGTNFGPLGAGTHTFELTASQGNGVYLFNDSKSARVSLIHVEAQEPIALERIPSISKE